MIVFAQGNLLEAGVDALVNTVNTDGIMGKGIALMFKERFPGNFRAYARACKQGEVRIGEMFVTQCDDIPGPEWIVNFPTKTHWRVRTRPEWIDAGLADLVRVIRDRGIRSIAVPPLGCGNGGLDWRGVRPRIEAALANLDGVEAVVYEPTPKYWNVAKKRGVERLTPARALVAEAVRTYGALEMDCTILEVQKLAWFIERGARLRLAKDVLRLRFEANLYGPYSLKLTHLLNSLDGSYLSCDKRLADATPDDNITFNGRKKDIVHAYLRSGEGKAYLPVLEWVSSVIDGFESPHGMELLATVDWLLERQGVEPTVAAIRQGLRKWPGGGAARKLRIFSERDTGIALKHLVAARADRLAPHAAPAAGPVHPVDAGAVRRV